jgi:hypothetical protein
VRIAMARQFVPRGDDAPNEGRLPARDLAQGEERSAHAHARAEFEHALGAVHHSALEKWPLVTVDRVRQGLDLEVLLDVDGQCIGHHGPGLLGSQSCSDGIPPVLQGDAGRARNGTEARLATLQVT